MSNTKKEYGVICKIWFGKETWVFSKHDVLPHGESDYLDLMRTREWPNVMDENTLDILKPPIDLKIIRNIPGVPSFKNFGIHRKDRSPFRVISQEQFDFLINASNEVEK